MQAIAVKCWNAAHFPSRFLIPAIVISRENNRAGNSFPVAGTFTGLNESIG
jgi:hypothetical protein